MGKQILGKILSFLLLAVATGIGTNASAQEVTFTKSSDGKTLVVTGYGDLSTYTKNVETSKTWTTDAVGNVFTSAASWAGITANATIDQAGTYYYTAPTKQLFDGKTPNTEGYYLSSVVGKIELTKFAEGTNVYKATYNETTKEWTIGNKITSESPDWDIQYYTNGIKTIDGVDYIPFATSTSELVANSTYTTENSDGVTFIKNDDAYNYADITYTVGNGGTLYVQKVGSQEKIKLSEGNTDTYNYGDLFYTDDYVQVTNLNDFLTEHPTYYTSVKSDVGLADLIKSELTSTGCTSIAFAQDAAHADDPIKLSTAVVSNILSTSGAYSTLQDNSSLVDLSKITLTDDLSKLPYDNGSLPSIILPSSVTDEVATNYIKDANKTQGGTIYWYSQDNTVLNVFNLSSSKLNKDNTSNLVISGTTKTISYKGNSISADVAKSFDINGVRNLSFSDANISISNDDYFAGFQYVDRVILPPSATNLATSTDFAKQDGSSVKVYQKLLTESNSTNVQSLQIKIVEAGGLAGLSDAHYYTDAFTNAPCVDVSGSANDNDVTFFNDLKTKRLNLSELTYKGTDTSEQAENKFMSIKNDEGLEYIALPDLGVDGGNFANMFAETPTLKGVAQMNSSNTYFSAALHNSEGKQDAEGTMDVLTAMFDKTKENAIRKIKISGDLNAKDISHNVISALVDEKNQSLSKDGHWVASTDVDNIAKDQFGAFSAFSQMNTDLDFSDARFANNQDFSLANTGLFSGNYLQNLKLPTDKSFTTIPHASLVNLGTGMTNGLTIPGNIKRIEPYAFFDNMTISTPGVRTTKVDGDGNGSYADDMIINNGERSLTLPEHLEYIGTGAFGGDDRFHDVYVLALKAPICERDAFDSDTYTGNNGSAVDMSKGVSEEAYLKDQQSFAVLHYPSALDGKPEELKYTDITRVYTLQDNTGATDANGKLLLWPSQEEWNKAYGTAYWGYLWNAWSMEVNRSNGFHYGQIETAAQHAAADAAWAAGDNTDATKYTDYIGWHQFILANRMDSKDDKDRPARDLSRFKTNDWYTFCVPYNIRKSDLQAAFGVVKPGNSDDPVYVDGKELDQSEGLYPIVCTLVGVKRDEKNNKITLIFSEDLVNQDVTISGEGGAPVYKPYTDEDPIIIKEGYPYLIKPYLPESKLKMEKYVAHIAQMDTDPHITAEGRSEIRIPYEKFVVKAVTSEGYGNKVAPDYPYRFGGVYSTHQVPPYSYYMANSKSQQRHIWFYLNSTKREKAWNPYSAIVAGKNITSTHIIPTADEQKLEGKNPNVTFAGEDDSFVTTSGAKKTVAMSFEMGGSTTGIDDINSNNEDDDIIYVDGRPVLTNPNAKIYNVSGQYVGNSLDGLAKGIYIVNGKKYVVK